MTVKAIVEGSVPNGALSAWGARQAANYAVDNWDALGKVGPEDRRAAIASHRDQADNPEPVLRQLLADLWAGVPRADPAKVPAEARQQWKALCAWLDTTPVEPIVWDRLVYEPHPARRYCGHLDLIARVEGRTLLIELQVRYPAAYHAEARLRLAGLRYAPQLLTADGRDTQPWPPIAGCAVLHVRPEGAALIHVQAGPRERAVFRAEHRNTSWLRTNTPRNAQ